MSDWKHPVHQVVHLVKRFWWSLRARPLDGEDHLWVKSRLLDLEWDLFTQLPIADQQHHLRVARRFIGRFDAEPQREWVAAALLHDVGKVDVGLGTLGRTFATIWPWGRRGDGRLGRYHRHVERGAQLLRDIGSSPETVALVGEHSDAPPAAAAALYWADNL